MPRKDLDLSELLKSWSDKSKHGGKGCGCGRRPSPTRSTTSTTSTETLTLSVPSFSACDSTSSVVLPTLSSTTCDRSSTSSSTCQRSSTSSSSTCHKSSTTRKPSPCRSTTSTESCESSTSSRHPSPVKPKCEEETICFKIRHGRSVVGPRGPPGKSIRGPPGPAGRDAIACDGKSLANNMVFTGCAIYIFHCHDLHRLDDKGNSVEIIALPNKVCDGKLLYQGIVAVNGIVKLSARVCADGIHVSDDAVYIITFDPKTGKVSKPEKIHGLDHHKKH
jgi:hypothetical protein